MLQRKVALVAASSGAFDHLVRALGRDGLLRADTGSDADAALVSAAKTQLALDALAAYLSPGLAAELAESYE